jgi:hypothetical protein
LAIHSQQNKKRLPAALLLKSSLPAATRRARKPEDSIHNHQNKFSDRDHDEQQQQQHNQTPENTNHLLHTYSCTHKRKQTEILQIFILQFRHTIFKATQL